MEGQDSNRPWHIQLWVVSVLWLSSSSGIFLICDTGEGASCKTLSVGSSSDSAADARAASREGVRVCVSEYRSG